MSELTKLTLIQAREKLINKEISSVELTTEFIKNIEKNKRLNAFITTNFEKALEQAKKSDENIAKKNIKKLEGLPIAVKDNFCTAGIETTAASNILKGFVPQYESTFTEKLLNENYVMIGKTNLDSFACGSTTMTSDFGKTINPLKANDSERDLIPGGSSGGSACAVAGEMALAATGTDTGGSIRQPATLCGLVGIKPTYGRVSRYGIVAYASSFDQAGWLTKDIRDSAYLTDIVCGKDTKDSTTVRRETTNFYNSLNPNVKGKTIGIIKDFMNLNNKVNPDIYKQFDKTVTLLKDNGCNIVEVSIPTINFVPELYTILSYTELASNLSRYDGVRFGHRTSEEIKSLDDLYYKSRTEGFCKNVQKRILLGYYFSSSENYEKWFLKSQKVRRKLVNEFLDGFNSKGIDFYITPATPQTAFPIELTDEEKAKNQESNYLNDLFVCPANMAGLPGLSIPTGKASNGLPIGVHLMGNYFDEQTLFNVGLFLEDKF